MSDGDAQMDLMIARLRALPRAMTVEVAPEIAEVVRLAIETTANAGTSADGVPWAPKKTGGRALEHAGASVKAAAIGSTVFVRIVGPEARHHRGWGKGGTKRQIIPTKGIPAPMAAAIRKLLDEKFIKAVAP